MRHSTPRQRSAALAALYGRPKRRRVSTGLFEGVEKDMVVKCSLYPQMIGRRMTGLTPRVYASFLYNGAATVRGNRLRPLSKGPTVSQKGRESDKDTDGRKARVLKDPDKTPTTRHESGSSQSTDGTMSRVSSFRSLRLVSLNEKYRSSGLPHDEYMTLVRHQQVQCVRAVLEPHFAHRGSQKDPQVWHGLKKTFQTRRAERRRISRLMYAVRKAMASDFDPRSHAFELAQYRHAAGHPYCELSDVDGRLLPTRAVQNFVRVFQQATKDKTYVPTLTALSRSKPAQWIDNQIRRITTLRRMNSGAAMNAVAIRPAMVSKLSWNSSIDEGARKQRRWSMMKQSVITMLSRSQKADEDRLRGSYDHIRGSYDLMRESVVKMGIVNVRSATVTEGKRLSMSSLQAVVDQIDDHSTT